MEASTFSMCSSVHVADGQPNRPLRLFLKAFYSPIHLSLIYGACSILCEYPVMIASVNRKEATARCSSMLQSLSEASIHLIWPHCFLPRDWKMDWCVILYEGAARLMKTSSLFESSWLSPRSAPISQKSTPKTLLLSLVDLSKMSPVGCQCN